MTIPDDFPWDLFLDESAADNLAHWHIDVALALENREDERRCAWAWKYTAEVAA